jgi:NitT/TauT family transport system ATP-binding protein
VFQEPTLFPWLTAQQNVEFGLINKGLSRKERQEKAIEVLRLVGLKGYGHARPHELSGGQRQRVALARVLVIEPMALLMDEPFSALDANTRERLQDELLTIRESHKQPILFVTHNADEAAYLADRVIVMGPPPGSVRADLTVPLPRPRDRFSDMLREVSNAFRDELSKLPCCIPKEGYISLKKIDTLVS